MKRSNIIAPELHARGDQPLGVLLVYGLARHAERLGDLGPAPAGAHRALDLRGLQPLGQAPQRHHGGQPVGRVLGGGHIDLHAKQL